MVKEKKFIVKRGKHHNALCLFMQLFSQQLNVTLHIFLCKLQSPHFLVPKSAIEDHDQLTATAVASLSTNEVTLLLPEHR